MSAYRRSDINRREALRRVSVLGAGGLLGLAAQPAAAEPPPETRTIRVNDVPVLCVAPQREAGVVKSTPKELIARGSEFKFQKELRRELKA